jgi:hypothetical protein
MNLTQEIEALARDIAADFGRDWLDCGEYERESFRDEARRDLSRKPTEIERLEMSVAANQALRLARSTE